MYNENTKRRTMKYLAKLKEIRFRVKPEECEEIKKAAEGYGSLRQFMLAAIKHEMERISEK